MYARSLPVTLLACCCVLCAHAQQTHIEPVVPAEPAAAAPQSAPSYASEPYVIEQEKQAYRYEADGSGERTLSATIHVQSDAATRQWGLLGFTYAAADEKVEIQFIHVQKPDGTVISTDPAAAQDQPLEVTREAPLYSDQRQLQVPVKGLAVGDRLSYQVVVHTHTPEAPGQFWNALYFERGPVALDEQYVLDVPAGVSLKVLSPGGKPSEEKQNGRHTYTWHATQLKPTVGDAAKKDTPDSPNVPDIAWTTFHNWAAVGDWWRTLAAGRAEPDAAIRAKAALLVGTATTQEEKLDRIYSFVSEQIRYIGVDFGVGRYQPHTAAEILANGYGDCKDKHTLLASLLAVEGIQADPVLIGAGMHFDKDLTAPDNFNHVITAVQMPGGKRLWLDATEEVAPPGMLIGTLRDEDALLMPASGEPTLVKTPAAPPFAPADTYSAHATLANDGKLVGHFTVSLHGDLELVCRMALFSGGQGQWQQMGQGISNALGFSGIVSAFQAQAVDEPARPLGFSYDYTREDYGDWPNHRILPLIPYGLFSMGDTLDKEPREPIRLGAARDESASSTITLPAGLTSTELPADAHVHSSFATFDLTYSRHGDDLLVSAHLQTHATSLPAASWQEYNQFLNDISNSQQFIQLRSGSASSPAATPAQSATPHDEDAGAQAAFFAIQEALKTGDIATAKRQLEAMRTADPKGRGVAFAAAAIEGTQKQWAQADADMRLELQRYPDEQMRMLPVLLGIEAGEKHPEKEVETLELLRAADPSNLQYPRAEAALLGQLKRNEEAISLLEGVALRHPGDRPVMMQLGQAQFDAGRPTEAKVTLETVLDGDTDPETLNDAAYQLADHGLDMPLAKTSTQKSLALLDTATAATDLTKLTRMDLGRQNLLVATWDTLGWIDYQDGDMKGAEDYLLAAWMTMQSPDNGYHLGMLYEKEAKPQQALAAYAMAQTAAQLPYAGKPPDGLELRTKALEAEGLKAPKPGLDVLAQQRMLNLPLLANVSGSADFFLLEAPIGVTAVQFVQGDDALKTQGPALQAALNHAHLPVRPADSKAMLLRRGSLSCSPSTHSCQFLLLRPQEARLPTPPVQVTAQNQ